MTNTESEIRELEEKLKQADVVSDPDLLDELLIDGFFFTAQNGAIYSKEQVLQAHRPAGARKFKRFDTSELRIHDYGNAVVSTIRVDLATESINLALLYTRFWFKVDGRWRIIGGSCVELEHSH